jgi:hypothetical protein
MSPAAMLSRDVTTEGGHMRSSQRGARLAAALAVSVVALAAAPSPAAAHPGHASCRGFGQEHAMFARELGGLGQFFREIAPLKDLNAAEHDMFCVPK